MAAIPPVIVIGGVLIPVPPALLGETPEHHSAPLLAISKKIKKGR